MAKYKYQIGTFNLFDYAGVERHLEKMAEKLITVLGSTGSIGEQALDVADKFGIRVSAISANSNVKRAEEQARKFNVDAVAMADERAAIDLKSRLFDTNTKVFSGADGICEMIEASNADVAVKFMQTFNTDYYRSKGSIISRLPDIARWYKPYLKALREWDTERAFYPDANLTLRVAYGKVAGYHYADGVYHRPYTTLDGIIEKDNPEIYDYNVPQALRDAYAAKDYGRWAQSMYGRTTVPVAFLAANHTTGGNSGSPILNAKGELLGLNFDRTWLSTMSDIQYDPEVCRNISVDIRYVLFFIDKIGGAGYLLDEMVLK